MTQFTVYDAKLGEPSGTPYYLRQITSSSFSENLQEIDGRMSGYQYSSAKFIGQGNPTAELTTTDIAGFVGRFGAEGLRMDDGTKVSIPFRTRLAGGSHVSGSNQSRVGGASSTSPVQLVPQSLTAPRMGPATAQGQVIFLSEDGIEKPHLVYDADQSLASQAFTGMYSLGPVFVNGTERPLNVGYTLNFGVQLSEMLHYAGVPYATNCFIEELNPSVDFTEEDLTLLYDFTGGAAISSLSLYLRKLLAGGTREDDAETVHIKFSLSGGLAVPTPLSASDRKHGSAGLRITSTGALTITTGIAITS